MEPEIGRKNLLKGLNGKSVFIGAVILAVAVAVGIGLYLAGGPANARQRQFDERRSGQLQSISSAIETYYRKYARLPGTLDDLRSPDYYLESLADPASGEPYGYNVTGDRSYELCAMFSRTSTGSSPNAPIAVYLSTPDFWKHGSGQQCFLVTIRLSAVGPICGIGLSACPTGQTCVVLPDTKEPVCIPKGNECAAAGCSAGCNLLESFPAQITCTKEPPIPPGPAK